MEDGIRLYGVIVQVSVVFNSERLTLDNLSDGHLQSQLNSFRETIISI